jgi:hypothetical protein
VSIVRSVVDRQIRRANWERVADDRLGALELLVARAPFSAYSTVETLGSDVARLEPLNLSGAFWCDSEGRSRVDRRAYP